MKSNMLLKDLSMQIGGIGKVTEHILRDALGITTCQEMLQKGAFLCALFSDCSAGLYAINLYIYSCRAFCKVVI